MVEEDQSKRYAAFISYRHVEPDRSLAHWLHRALENYRVPPAVARKHRTRIGRIFRDEEELAASHDLSAEIEQALQDSDYLIVVCSPRAPESRWVNREVERFHELGRADRVLALLIEGEPRDSFPPALRAIRPAAEDDLEPHEVEPLAADVRPIEGESLRSRRQLALLRTAARLLGCRFDELRQREAARARKRRIVAGSVLCALVALFGVLAWWAFWQRDQVLRLSDEREVGQLIADEDTCWPVHPDAVPAMQAWLRRAEDLQKNAPSHRQALVDLRSAARAPIRPFRGGPG